MGTHDRVMLEPPIICPHCGASHDSVSSALLTETMTTWRIGSFIRGCPVHTGLLREEVLCCKIGKGKYQRIPLWIIIWHGVYAGHSTDETTAHQRMNSIDRLDLLHWLDQAQTATREWRGRYRSLHRDLANWIDYRDRPPVEEGESTLRWSFGIFNRLPDEIVNDPDPLSRILETNAEDLPPSGMWLDD